MTKGIKKIKRINRPKMNEMVYEYCKSHQISYNSFCHSAGCWDSLFTPCEFWRGRLAFKTIEKVANQLGVNPEIFLSDEIITATEPMPDLGINDRRKKSITPPTDTDDNAPIVPGLKTFHKEPCQKIIKRQCVRCNNQFKCKMLSDTRLCEQCDKRYKKGKQKWNG